MTNRRQLVTFVLLGASNTLITLLLYWLLLRWMPHTVAYAISYAAGIGYGAVTNARFTFRTRLTGAGFARFAAWTVGLYAFNALLLEVLVRGAGMDARVAVLVVVAVAVPLGFVGARWAIAGVAPQPTREPEAPRAGRGEKAEEGGSGP